MPINCLDFCFRGASFSPQGDFTKVIAHGGSCQTTRLPGLSQLDVSRVSYGLRWDGVVACFEMCRQLCLLSFCSLTPCIPLCTGAGCPSVWSVLQSFSVLQSSFTCLWCPMQSWGAGSVFFFFLSCHPCSLACTRQSVLCGIFSELSSNPELINDEPLFPRKPCG